MNSNRRPKIRAPRVDGSYVVQPEGSVERLIVENRAKIAHPVRAGLSGFSSDRLLQLRQQARSEFSSAASEYTNSYAQFDSSACGSSFSADTTPLLVSGHQPEFFHPGVWFKNFLLSKLRQRCGGVSINLCVDNDNCRSRSIAVPSGSLEMPRRQMVDFDSPVPEPGLSGKKSPTRIGSAERIDHSATIHPITAHQSSADSVQFLPYETAIWNSRSTLAEFPGEVKAALGSLDLDNLLLDPIWEILHRSLKRTNRVGESVAQTRHLFEMEQGLDNLEVPVSSICQQPAFFEFLADLWQSAKPFQELYNDSLREFRRQNRIRSHSHPVPELVETDGWLEMPFWIWSDDSPERGPLYINQSQSEILLSDLDQIETRMSADRLLEQLFELRDQGISIRPRALMTTMFSRIFLADVFIHGIGGAKYDELTDRIIERFYGVRPPAFLTATSTHLLPLVDQPFDVNQIREAKRNLRNLRFHPEKHLSNNPLPETPSLMRAKQQLLAEIPPRGQKKRWHQQLEQINQQLSQDLQQERSRLQQELSELEIQRRRSGILASREYSFLIHPIRLVAQLHRISDEAADKFF